MRWIVAVILVMMGIGDAKAEFGTGTQIPETEWAIAVDKETGTCAVGASYNNGHNILVVQRGQAWVFIIQNENWRLTPGNTYDIYVSFDYGVRNKWSAEATTVNSLALRLTDVAVTVLSRASIAQIYNDRGTLVTGLILTGSSKALTLLGQCADSFEGTPFGEGKPNRGMPFGQGKERGA